MEFVQLLKIEYLQTDKSEVFQEKETRFGGERWSVYHFVIKRVRQIKNAVGIQSGIFRNFIKTKQDKYLSQWMQALGLVMLIISY